MSIWCRLGLHAWDYYLRHWGGGEVEALGYEARCKRCRRVKYEGMEYKFLR